MADSTEFDGLTPEEREEIERLPDNHPALKALRATRSELKTERAKGRIASLSAQHPELGLTEEDFKGLKPEEYESRVQRFIALKGEPVVAAPASPEPPAAPAPTISDDAFRRMAQPLEQVAPASGAKQLELNEAWALYKKDPAEFERVKAAGLIKNWPTAEDKGGAIVYR